MIPSKIKIKKLAKRSLCGTLGSKGLITLYIHIIYIYIHLTFWAYGFSLAKVDESTTAKRINISKIYVNIKLIALS